MLLQTQHFSLVMEQLANETQTDFKAMCLFLRKMLDERPDNIHELDHVVAEARRYVAYHEKDCEVDIGYTLFGSKSTVRKIPD